MTTQQPPLFGQRLAVRGENTSVQVAAWFLRNLGAEVEEDPRSSPELCDSECLDAWVGAGGLPVGTVDYGVGLALAAAGLLSALGHHGAVVTPSEVMHNLLLPAILDDPHDGPNEHDHRMPLPWRGGALACDLRAPGDPEAFDRLLCTDDHPAELPAAMIAELAQQWRLPVVEYVSRIAARELGRLPVVSGVGWGARAHPRWVLQRPVDCVLEQPGDISGLPGRHAGGGPLAGVSVVDMTSMWAGPLATCLLAAQGAEVIKVEPSCRLDGMRGTPEMFAVLNERKRVVDLDLRSAHDRSAFFDLVARADLVIDSFSPRVMPNLGLTRSALVDAGGDSLVTLSMPAFPQGPRRSWIAYGNGVHAASGLGDLGDGRFYAPSVSYPDPIAGLTAYSTVLALLVGRHFGWRPRHAEVTIFGATLPLLWFQDQWLRDECGGPPSQSEEATCFGSR